MQAFIHKWAFYILFLNEPESHPVCARVRAKRLSSYVLRFLGLKPIQKYSWTKPTQQ